MSASEEWRDIPGWEGLYQVSSLGRVQSLTKTIHAISRWGTPQVYEREGRVLKLKVDKDGYLSCHLVHDGKNQHFKAHQLVCRAFNGPSPSPKHVVAHNDGTRTNNVPDNLRWATPKENHHDRDAHGTWARGTLHGRAKLTDKDV